jgi:hypothetical protein
VTGGRRVVYEELYDNIDLHVYSNAWGPKLYLVMHPGADPGQVLMYFEGHDSMAVDLDGALKLYSNTKHIRLEQAMAYQLDGQTIVPVLWAAMYSVANDSTHVQFEFFDYDPDLPLIFSIHPLLPQMPGGGNAPPEWSTFVAGALNDALNDLTHDDDGYVYFTGESRSGASGLLPISQGAWQPANAGGSDAIIGRFNRYYEIDSEDTWMTYLGSYDDDLGSSIVFDRVNDRVVVAGRGTLLPLMAFGGNPISYQRQADWWGGFVAFFDKENGFRTYLTGTPGTAAVHNWIDVDVDMAGNTYVVGSGPGFLFGPAEGFFDWTYQPPPGSYFQAVGSGTSFTDMIGYVLQLDPVANLTWFTHFGGDGMNVPQACKVDKENDWLYVAGSTASQLFSVSCSPPGFPPNNGFPLCDAGGYFQPYNSGTVDGFIARFDLPARSLQWSTFFGGSGEDAIVDMAVVGDGSVYVTGYSTTTMYSPVDCQPPTQGGFPICDSGGIWPLSADRRHFIARFSSDTELLWSTKVGDNTSLNAGPGGLLCRLADAGDGGVLMLGTTYAQGTPMAPVPILPDGGGYHQSNPSLPFGQANAEGYIFRVTDTHQIVWSTYFGGGGHDTPRGITAPEDRVYICGATYSAAGFPLGAPEIPNHQPYLNAVPQSSLVQDRADGFIAQLRTTPFTSVEEIWPGDRPAGLLIYPNPGTDQVTLVLPSGAGQGHLVIVNGLGQLVRSIPLTARGDGVVQISLEGLVPGVHTLVLNDGTDRYFGRFVKQ